jgi:hypothetical protein
MDVTAEAEAVFQLMCDHQDDDCLKWSEDGSVRVQIGKIVPRSGPQQTVANRRKRLRNALDNLVEEAGGQVLGPNRYRLREQP